MALFKKMPLRSAWYGLIILASLLPALVLAPWLSQQAHTLLLSNAMLKEEIYHKEVETRLHLETDRLLSVLINKSDPIAHFISPGNNAKMIETLIAKIIEREPIINTTTVYDTKGNMIASRQRSSHTPAEINADSPAFAIPMFNRTYVSSPALLSDGHFEFLIAVPLPGEHEPLGVMISTININEYWQSIKHDVARHDSRIYLVDGRGSLLTDLPGSQYQQGDLLSDRKIVRSLLAGKDWHRHEIYNGFEGTDVFGIASPVRSLQWGIISEIPADDIMASIVSALSTLSLIVILLHVIFGLISLLFTGRLLNPISELARAVKQATRGDYSHHVQPSSYREIDSLTSSFNIMTHEIEQRESSLNKLSQAIAQAGDAIFIANREGSIEYVNPAFSKITGFSAEEVTGNDPQILSGGLQPEELHTEMWQTIQSGQTWEGRLIDRKKDGSNYPVMLSIAPIFDGDEITHYVAIQQDMSEHDQLEEKLRQAQKMESLGTLVGGIAHDFNNILAAMTSNLFLVKRQLADNQKQVLQRVETIESLAYSAANMISHLLAFARKSPVQMSAIDFNALIRQSEAMLSSNIPAHIKFTLTVCDQPLCILGDATQLQQVLINMVNNARDAVRQAEAPEVSISVDAGPATDAFLAAHPEASEGIYLRLSICDNGQGILPEHQKMIFEPFFTTKGVGEGSGLGLSMVFGTVQTHQGFIEIDSTPSVRTCFRLYFPCIDEHQPDATPVEALYEEKHYGNGQCILLVDDDKDLLSASAAAIESMGYRVITAENGQQGIDLFYSHMNEVQLVITDLVMPIMGGIELARCIKSTFSGMPIICTTGYDREQLLDDHTETCDHILTKPIHLPELSRLINQLLKADKPKSH